MLDIELKEDSAEKLSAINGQPTKFYLFAEEFNAIVNEINNKQNNLSYPSSDDKVYGVKNGVIEEIALGSLEIERFEFEGSQVFTLTDNFSKIFSVIVNGVRLDITQYSELLPNQIEILDTLEGITPEKDFKDYIIVLYSTAPVGIQPYFSQAEVLNLLAGFIPLSGTINPVTGKVKFLDADGNQTFYIGKDEADDKLGINYYSGTYKSKVVPGIENIEIQGDKANFRGLVGYADYSPNYNELTYIQKIFITPSKGTGTNLPTNKIGGYYGNMATGDSANSAILYNLVGDLVVGCGGVVRINAPTQPSIVGATLIDGADFIADNDMHMVYQYFGDVVQYYFLKL